MKKKTIVKIGIIAGIVTALFLIYDYIKYAIAKKNGTAKVNGVFKSYSSNNQSNSSSPAAINRYYSDVAAGYTGTYDQWIKS